MASSQRFGFRLPSPLTPHHNHTLIDHKGLYFQFPICLLTTDHNYKTILNQIITYGMKEVGNRLDSNSEENEPEKNEAKIAEFCRKYDTADGLTVTQFHLAWGAQALGVTIPCIHEEARKYGWLEDTVAKFGDSGRALCRIKLEWIWDSLRGGMLSEREFRVLVAIYSAIGNKPFRRITREEIRRRSCGYASKARYEQDIAAKAPKFNLTDSQIKTTVAKLQQLNFFAKVTYARRVSYYTHRLQVDDLVEAVKGRLISRFEKKSRQQEINRSLTEDVRAAYRDMVNLTQRPML